MLRKVDNNGNDMVKKVKSEEKVGSNLARLS